MQTIPFCVPDDLCQVVEACPSCIFAESLEQLCDLAIGDVDPTGWHTVSYDVPGKGHVVEAKVCKVTNGYAANYVEPYMRRRDPNCMVIGDNKPTNKTRYVDRFNEPFDNLRQETFDWLKPQELVVVPFAAGNVGQGLHAVAVVPVNAAFFAVGLAMLQGMITAQNMPENFSPKAVVYVAPPFRHTHFDGKQVVVHNRTDGLHELFSYNLYPGPSAKKGVYGMLLTAGEKEDWITAHCSTVQIVTPYDNKIVIMHEGASGGGKSEMIEGVHRERDGSLLIGRNVVNDERRHVTLPRTCELRPVTDDMALCLPSIQRNDGRLQLMDAEDAWFLRVNHIEHYGTDPELERTTVEPPQPLLFLNIKAVPGGTALIWDHVEDQPAVPCPNPRVIVPREIVPNIINGSVNVDVRSFGVRCPACTREKPTYGIMGMCHILPPALAWLWRLVAPRGHGNPSIISTEAMASEGVGSYWPFATGRRVDQANLLLDQIVRTPAVRYVLMPNQHIGAWEVGFMPQWIVREYLARRGRAPFSPGMLDEARCPLLGYTLHKLMVEGQTIGSWFLRVDAQPEVGEEAYDAGAQILQEFFARELSKFDDPDLEPLGQQIIQCFRDNGTVTDYNSLLAADPIVDENG